MQGLSGDLDLFLRGDPAQMLLQSIEGNAAEIKALAAAQDGGQHPLGVGGGQHEHHSRRRLLQRFEQGVERGRGEHVALVHHVHLPAGLHRRKAGAFDQLADVVDAGIGSGIDLDHIEGVAGCDGAAQLTGATRLRRWPIGADAVKGARQDAGAGGFTGAAWAAEQVGRCDPARSQGVAEGGRNRLLAHQLIEALGPVFVMEGLIGGRHGWRLLAALKHVLQLCLQLLHLAELIGQLLGGQPQGGIARAVLIAGAPALFCFDEFCF